MIPVTNRAQTEQGMNAALPLYFVYLMLNGVGLNEVSPPFTKGVIIEY